MTDVLRLLKQCLPGIFSAKASSPVIQTSVDSDERISRFVLNSKHINSSGRPKPTVFEPSRLHKNISVYRTGDLSEIEIWDIAFEYIEKLRKDNKKIVARADLSANYYFNAGLQFDPDGVPHIRHANVINWPTEKMEIKLITVQLANDAELVRR